MPKLRPTLFKWRHFEPEIIICAVRWYLRFSLSYRDVARWLAPLRKTKWVVYAKPPFGGPERVLDYLGRYTHRVAISNNRLLDMQDGKVT